MFWSKVEVHVNNYSHTEVAIFGLSYNPFGKRTKGIEHGAFY